MVEAKKDVKNVLKKKPIDQLEEEVKADQEEEKKESVEETKEGGQCP